MATTQKPRAVVAEDKKIETDGFDPRETDHPTGEAQAAENAANDPPG